MDKLEVMMGEVQALVRKSGVILTTEDIQVSLSMFSNFPFQSKSSLQLDFENKNSKNRKRKLLGLRNKQW